MHACADCAREKGVGWLIAMIAGCVMAVKTRYENGIGMNLRNGK